MPLNLKETTIDWLVCQCGNEPHLDGFYTCLSDGRPAEPVLDGLWQGHLYICAKCYSIYDIDTLDEVGKGNESAVRMLTSGEFLE
jgi:hypothetical protein